LVEAFLAKARVGPFPRNSGLAEQGLGDAVQHGCPIPVTLIAVQERQPEKGAGHVPLVAGPAADPQAFLECGSRAVEVLFGPQDYAQVQ
jgi:hypothetical protein